MNNMVTWKSIGAESLGLLSMACDTPGECVSVTFQQNWSGGVSVMEE